MKYSFGAAAVLLFASTVVADKRDLCSDGSTDDNGNWYCQEVTAVTYKGVGGDSSYNKITDMASSGSCSSTPQAFSGTMSPLDEEVSMHFRGPLNLKQFAVYIPGSTSSKKARRSNSQPRRRGHPHHHAAHHVAREAQVGAEVTATIDGQVVSWANEYSGEATSAPAASSAAPTTAEAAAATVASVASSATSAAAASSASSASEGFIGSSSSSEGGWARVGYYDATSGTSDGLVFLNHNGGSGSGVFDYVYGNSLSYASTDGCTGAGSAQTLADTTLPSSAEVVIMSDNQCGSDDCGYVRPGTVAYHGFDGPEKAFLMEFEMPDSGESAASIYDPVNMPAVWMLNAQIPRTLQYGNPECSCWTTGCGEFDIFEVLAAGDSRAKSTLHGTVNGGDSDYFARPTSGTIKVATILSNNNIHIKVLDDSTDFASVLSSGTLDSICSSTLTQSKKVSLFQLSGK